MQKKFTGHALEGLLMPSGMVSRRLKAAQGGSRRLKAAQGGSRRLKAAQGGSSQPMAGVRR
jgi:hypothetical protein